MNFRSAPSVESIVYSALCPGAPLFVVSTEKSNGYYYYVIDIESNVEGYVHSNYVTLGELIP